MPTKKKDALPAPAPMVVAIVEPVVIPIPPSILIMRSMPLQQLIHIMLNGSRSPQFNVHSGLVSKIWNAYKLKDTEKFILCVQQYLQQAVFHVAQAGKPEEVPKRVQDLRDLIAQAGLEMVGQRILSVVHATL